MLYALCIRSWYVPGEMFDLDAFKLDLAKKLRALEASLESLTAELTHDVVSATVAGADTPKLALRQAIHAYASIRYDMEDATNESPVCVGLIAAPAAVLARARQVNDAKASLKALCAPLRLRQVRVPVRVGSKKTEKISVVRAGLRSLQASDVNLMAAYRKIQILEVPPEVVQFSRARTRSVYRLSIEKVEELLAPKEGAIATADRARLARLPRNITHLALVSDHYRNVRANVLNRRLDKRGRGRVQMSAELPLLYLARASVPEPEVIFPGPEPEEPTVLKPRPSKLESEPFLQSLSVYRYAQSPGRQPR